ncbi:MAG: hypothetical protein N4A40_08150 [Tissierellales bacterium]|jgi:hypothetical protein|nr:hypothetical protein [Tissierellales bacterium]
MKRKFELQILTMLIAFLMIPIFSLTYLAYSDIRAKVFLSAEKEIEFEFRDKQKIIVSHLDRLFFEVERLDIENSGLSQYIDSSISNIAGVEDVVVIKSNGEEYINTGDIGHMREIKNLIESKLLVLPVQLFRIDVEQSEYPRYILIKRKYDEKSFIGYIAVEINMNEFLDYKLKLELKDIQIFDENYQRVYSNKGLNVLESEVNEITKKMIDGETGIGEADGNLTSYGHIDYLDTNLYILISDSMEGVSDGAKQTLYKFGAVAVFLIMLTMLFAWRVLRFIDKKMVELLLKDAYKNHEFLHLSSKLNEAIEWIDDVVLHYDELNRLKDELIEINNELPKEEDVHDKKFIISKYFKKNRKK